MICVDFLEDAVEKNNNCIIITHHLPSNSLIDNKYKVPNIIPYNQWFYCNMDSFIEKNKSKIDCQRSRRCFLPINIAKNRNSVPPINK